MDENKVCPLCNTINESNYSFCKNCGNRLDSENSDSNTYTPPSFNSQYGNYNPFSMPEIEYSEIEKEIDGVDTKKIEAFVGKKKKDYFLQRFIAMQRTGKKGFWNWPIALLGSLISFPFLSSWFFYRKMYKIGFIICSVFLAISCIVTFATFNETANLTTLLMEEILAGTTDPTSLQNIINMNSSSTYSNISFFQSILSIGGTMFLGMMGNYFYKKHTVSTIKKIDLKIENAKDCDYAKKGTPNVIFAVIIPMIFSFINIIISYLPFYFVMSNLSKEQLFTIISNLGGGI